MPLMFVIQTQEIFLGERSYLIGPLTVCLFDYGCLRTSCIFCKSLFLNRNDIKFKLCITLLVCGFFFCLLRRNTVRKVNNNYNKVLKNKHERISENATKNIYISIKLTKVHVHMCAMCT